MKLTMPLVALVVALLLVASQAVYTVEQTKWAIKFQLGEIVEVNSEAGLYFKMPLVQNVRFFDRRNLLFFGAEVGEELRFTRKDNGAAVDVTAHLERVPSEPHMGELMAACITGRASDEVQREFGRVWQERVRRMLVEHAHDPQVIVVHPVRAV